MIRFASKICETSFKRLTHSYKTEHQEITKLESSSNLLTKLKPKKRYPFHVYSPSEIGPEGLVVLSRYGYLTTAKGHSEKIQTENGKLVATEKTMYDAAIFLQKYFQAKGSDKYDGLYQSFDYTLEKPIEGWDMFAQILSSQMKKLGKRERENDKKAHCRAH